MISQLLHPVLATLSKEQIEDGVDYLEAEISKLRIDGLLRDRQVVYRDSEISDANKVE